MKSKAIYLIVLILLLGLLQEGVSAAPAPAIQFPQINIQMNNPGQPKASDEGIPRGNVALPFQILALLSILSLAPYLLVMLTSFIRITIVFSFIRSALGTQQVPPTQVLMGMALFLTFFVMAPVGQKVNEEALQPYFKGDISQEVFLQKALKPIRDFMFRQVRKEDIKLFISLSGIKHRPKNEDEVPTYVLIPAFMISEVKTAFEIGFAIYIPFLVIDMVVSSVLMSMGMFMLSPMTISMPFKLLMFVLVDGWGLIVESLVRSFR